MAATSVTTTAMSWQTLTAFPAAQALDATDGCLISGRPDQKALIYLENTDSSNSETVTVKGGSGPMAFGDKTFTLAVNSQYRCSC